MNKSVVTTIYEFLTYGEIKIEVTTKGCDVINGIYPRCKVRGLVSDYRIAENRDVVNLGGENFGFRFYEKNDHLYKIEEFENILIIDITNQDFKIKLYRTSSHIKPIGDSRIVSYYEKDNIRRVRYGYLHKFTTRKDYDYCEEFAIIENLNGNIEMCSLDNYSIKFINDVGGEINE